MLALEFTTSQWALIAAMIVAYLAICVRTALRMARTGRNFWLWLGITVFTTSIPATVVLFRDQMKAYNRYRRPRREPRIVRDRDADDEGRDDQPDDEPGEHPDDEAMIRCGQCGRRFRRADADRTGPVPACPHCHLPLDEETLA